MKVVYTSLHGTGVPIIPDVLKHLNFQNVSLVKSQCELDPNFSSVKSANPEEREAFDLAIQQAHDLEANLVIATDPDVDRMGFVERNAMVKHITLVVVKLAHYSLNICSNTRMCRIIRLLFNLL